MGKHDEQSHLLHIKKNLKFKQAAPKLPINPNTARAPQQPRAGQSGYNLFR